jgi:hypothetical protein
MTDGFHVNPPMVAPDGSKSVGVDCCPDLSFATAREADAHEAACPAHADEPARRDARRGGGE